MMIHYDIQVNAMNRQPTTYSINKTPNACLPRVTYEFNLYCNSNEFFEISLSAVLQYLMKIVNDRRVGILCI